VLHSVDRVLPHQFNCAHHSKISCALVSLIHARNKQGQTTTEYLLRWCYTLVDTYRSVVTKSWYETAAA